ncbi:ATP-binding protein [Streptomyces sp. NPDC127049]|uniref:ATP-binding protein n=1 Tax=Streptomyces sp. NPDC127049 TaxID=3347118 RepID=UPI00364C0A40
MTLTAPPSTSSGTRLVVALPWGLRSPAAARRIAAGWLEAGAYARTADAVLIVSELVTNTVRHTRGPCLLTLSEHDGSLDIAVSDHSEDMPDLHPPAAGGRRGGFGLEIMGRLGDSVQVVPRIGGKTVRVVLRTHAPAPTPARVPGHVPASASARVPASAPTSAPARVPASASARVPAFVPALAQAHDRQRPP